MSKDLRVVNLNGSLQGHQFFFEADVAVRPGVEGLILSRFSVKDTLGFMIEAIDLMHAFDDADELPEGLLLTHHCK